MKKVTFRFINDPAAQVAALLAGDIDGMPRYGALESLKQFQGDPRFSVVVGGTEGKTIMTINNKKKPFDDVRVRRALAAAIDRKAIIDGAQEGYRHADRQPHGAERRRLRRPDRASIPYNPEKAKALLKEAGVTTPLNVTLTLPPPAYARKGGEIIASQLAKVGVVAKIENVEWAQWLSGAFKGNFDLTVISHVEPLDFDRYADPAYYYGYDSKAYRDLLRRLQLDHRPEGPAQAARRHPAPARDRQRQRLPVPAAAVRGRQQAAEGHVEQLADLRQRPRRADLAVSVAVAGPMTALHDLAATELVARFRERSLSPVEVTRAVLDRIAAWEPHLHATYALDAEAALAAARASEARWLRHVSAGENVGALDGVPAMIKENIATAGTPVPLGTAATELVPARATRRRRRACARPAR